MYVISCVRCMNSFNEIQNVILAAWLIEQAVNYFKALDTEVIFMTLSSSNIEWHTTKFSVLMTCKNMYSHCFHCRKG